MKKVWHSSIILDSLLGGVEFMSKVESPSTEKDAGQMVLELCDKKGNTKHGTVKLAGQTSEYLRLF